MVQNLEQINKGLCFPLISVVIPAYNESNFISRVLDSLRQQDYANFEVIVVNNNSSDNTAEIALKYGVRVISENKPGVANARQAGFAAACGEIIATTDADTILPEDWLSKIYKKFSTDKNLVAYGGLYKLSCGPILTRIFFSKAAYYFWKLERKIGGSWSLPGVNMAVRKSAFNACGGFNLNLKMGEDADLSRRIREFGTVVLDKSLIVKTSGRRYRKGFIAAAYNYVPNVVARDLFQNQNFMNELPAIRKESLSPLAYSGPVVVIFVIALVFFNGTFLAKAQKIEDRGEHRIVLDARYAEAYLHRINYKNNFRIHAFRMGRFHKGKKNVRKQQKPFFNF